MPTGRVKWFRAERGFGFITPDEGGNDIFVHFSAVRGAGYRSLDAGARVAFDVGPGPKGLRALDVTRTDGEPVELDSRSPSGRPAGGERVVSEFAFGDQPNRSKEPRRGRKRDRSFKRHDEFEDE